MRSSCVWALVLFALSSCSAEHEAQADAAGVDEASSFADGDPVPPDDAYAPTFPDGGSLVTTHCLPIALPSGGFVGNEVYVESGHAECGGGPCMVFHLVGNPECPADDPRCTAPSASACFDAVHGADLCVDVDGPGISTAPTSPDRVFCSCRCSAGGNPSLPLCTCGSDARCVADADPGGGYCVPAAL